MVVPWLEHSIRLTGHNHTVSALRVSGNGKLLASASADKTVIVWNTETWEAQTILTGHTEGINDIAFGNNAPRQLYTASDDHTVRRFSLAAKKSVMVNFIGHTSPVVCITVGPKSRVVSGAVDGTVILWGRGGIMVGTLQAHQLAVTGVRHIDTDCTMLATASLDGMVRVWDMERYSCLRTVSMPGNIPITDLDVDTHFTRLLVYALDNGIRIYTLPDVDAPTILVGSHLAVTRLVRASLIPTGERAGRDTFIVATGNDNPIGTVYDASTGKARGIAAMPEGSYVAAAAGTAEWAAFAGGNEVVIVPLNGKRR